MIKRYSLLGALCMAAAIPLSAQITAPASDMAETPAPIQPPVQEAGGTTPIVAPIAPILPPDDAVAAVTPAQQAVATPETVAAPSSRSLNEFQGDDVSQVLRLLARQARINLVISDKVDQAQPPLKVTMRLENKTPIEAIKIIATSKGLITDVVDDVYYVKTKEEKEAEPTESAFYTFSYGSAEKILPLLAAQLQSKAAPQVDPRTNTIFYREVGSNLKNIELFLATIDKPTQQVMIEARLVEVTANPRQAYGINWAGVVGGSSSPQTFRFAGSGLGTSAINLQTDPNTGTVSPVVVPSTLPSVTTATNGSLQGTDFLGKLKNGNPLSGIVSAIGGQFAILSAPQMTLTLRLLNEDADAEFLANPRVVTANNLKATIKITRNQPVPQLNFNEQTATAVFGGFEDKEFGNTLECDAFH